MSFALAQLSSTSALFDGVEGICRKKNRGAYPNLCLFGCQAWSATCA